MAQGERMKAEEKAHILKKNQPSDMRKNATLEEKRASPAPSFDATITISKR